MRFLEKDLEDLIYNHYNSCFARGFTPLEVACESELGIWIRQPNLAPFGIADLINIRMDRPSGTLKVSIIECKQDVVDAHTYAQAARYAYALRNFKYCHVLRVNNEWPMIDVQLVLVGRRVSMSGDFGLMCDSDHTCSIFTYNYGPDGISFAKYRPNLTSYMDCQTADSLLVHTSEYLSHEVMKFNAAHPNEKFEAHFLPF